MAKAKKTTKVTPAKPVAKEVTINLDTFAVPIAIIVAGLIIALTIFLTNKANTDSSTSGTGDNVAQEQGVDTGEDVTVSLGNDPYLGDKDKAKVAIVEFSDYQCGYCKLHSDETFPSIKKDYIDTGKVIYVFKEFPLGDSGLRYTTALAGICVNDQLGREKFAEFHSGAMGAASEDDVRALAVSLGADGAKYDSCVSSAQFKDEISQDILEGGQAGINGTPGFIVGTIDKDGNITGQLIAGYMEYGSFQSVIDGLLE